LQEKIKAVLPEGITLLSQGEIVAQSLQAYLQRHPEMEQRISKERRRHFYTTDSAEEFNSKATVFFGDAVQAAHVAV
jgi:glutamate racemase